MLALHTDFKSVDALSKSGKLSSCDFTIVIKEWETTSFRHYVLSDHSLCGNYGNMLITSKTCRASNVISILGPIRIMLSHTLKLTAGTPTAIISDPSHCRINSIVQTMPQSCSSSSDRDGMLLRLQGYELQSFIKSIGGEESPSASDCITLHDRYGVNSYVFHAFSSEETNECQRPLKSCVFHAVSSGETDEHQRLLLLPRTTLHSMPH